MSDYLTPEEVADRLRLSRETVYILLREGNLPSTKLNRFYRVTEEQLAQFLSKKEVNK